MVFMPTSGLANGGANESEKSIYFRKRVISNLTENQKFPLDENVSNLKNPKDIQTWVLQFSEPITEKLKSRLISRRIIPLKYIPDDALLVRSSFMKINDFFRSKTNQNKILKVMNYDADLKLSPGLGVFSVFNAEAALTVVIKVFNNQDALNFQKLIQKEDVLALQSHDLYFEVRTTRKNIFNFAKYPEVEFIQEKVNFISMYLDTPLEGETPVDSNQIQGDYSDLSGRESGTQIMNFEMPWSKGFFGEGEYVAMADTGLDSGNEIAIHQDFLGAVHKGQAVGLFSKSWADPMGHGTHVAGSILGRGIASGGLLKGGAFESKMIAQGMWSPMLNNLSVPSKMGELFKKAFDEGARIHSNSWGSPKNLGEYDQFASQTDEYIYQNPEILVLFAAGNSGVDLNRDGRIDAGSISSPGTAKNVLTVGASENEVSNGGIQVPAGKLRQGKDNWSVDPIASDLISNNRMGLAMFSSRGPTVDGRIKPEVVAPGTNILSVRSQEKESSVLWGAYNNDYVWAGGTSMATPLTAGAATLVREYLKKQFHQETPTGALIKGFLMHKAVDMYPGQFGEVGASLGQEILNRRPNSDEGYGRVDMAPLFTAERVHIYDEKFGVSQGEEMVYTISIKEGSKSFLANLVWTDAPATPAAGKSLVNDLDLFLMDDQGQVLYESKDHINNHEIMEFTNLGPGQYRMGVRGYKVPNGKSGKQSFALIYSF